MLYNMKHNIIKKLLQLSGHTIPTNTPIAITSPPKSSLKYQTKRHMFVHLYMNSRIGPKPPKYIKEYMIPFLSYPFDMNVCL